MEYIDRELSEIIWQESLDMMTPGEIAEMVRRQEFERSQDYWDAAWTDMRNAIEGEAEQDAVRDMLAA